MIQTHFVVLLSQIQILLSLKYLTLRLKKVIFLYLDPSSSHQSRVTDIRHLLLLVRKGNVMMMKIISMWEKLRKDLGRGKGSNQVPLVKVVVRIRGNDPSPCIYLYFGHKLLLALNYSVSCMKSSCTLYEYLSCCAPLVVPLRTLKGSVVVYID